MVMINNMGEARSTPSYPSMPSPRYGGCVSAFLQFFDWTPAKRFSSTKRLSANKPEKAFRRSRSFRGDHGSAGKTRMMYHCRSGANAVLDQVPGGVNGDPSTRAPGVVARLMGLDSLPEGPYQPPRHRRSQSYSGGESVPHNLHRDDHHGTPILLQDLLKRDFKTSKKTLRDRIPGIFPKRAQEQHEKRFRKKSVSVLTAFRCRPEVSCVSPAYIDIPTSRFLYAVAQKEKDGKQLPFLSRLPAGSQLHTPVESPSIIKSANHLLSGEKIPELSLRASSTGSTVLLQGWPLASQHNVPRDLFHDDEPAASFTSQQSSLHECESVGSRPTDSASSKPLMAIGSYKVVQGRRRGSSWNGSEDSESTFDQAVHRKPPVGRGLSKKAPPSEESVSPPRHRNSRSKSVISNEPAFKITRRPSSKSSVPKVQRSISAGKRDADRQPLILQVENSRTSISQESMSTGSLGSISSKASTATAGRGKASKTGRVGRSGAMSDASSVVTTKMKSKEDNERHLGKQMASTRSMSKDMAPGKPAPLDGHRAVKARNQKGVAQQENSASRVFPAGSPSKGSSSLVAQSGDLPDGINLPKSSIPSYGIRLFGGRKELDKPLVTKKKAGLSDAEVKMGSSALGQHSSPALQRFTEKAGRVAGKQTTKREPRLSSETKTQVQDLGDRLKNKNMHLEDMATQSSAARVGVKGDDADEAILRSSRRNKSQNKHARARSVDDVFPELPLDIENSKVDSPTSYTCASKEEVPTDRESLSVNSSLNRPVERLLFGQGFSSSPDIDFTECKNGAGDQISSSPLVDFSGAGYSSGACMLGRLNSSVSLIDYDEVPYSGEYGKEADMLEGLSSSPLIDCEELRGLREGPPGSSAENELIPIELYQVQDVDFAAGLDDLRWEDAIVETILSGRCCERSCSGPSISSQSVSSDVDDERNGDSWSSSASYNPGDCESLRTFQITELDVEPEALIEEHKSPPTQFVKKILEEDQLVDEAGQPSPVSILNSPFHDEACTTSESGLTESIQQQFNSEVIVDEERLDLPSSSTTNISNSDKIRQALLDISLFRSHEECSFEAQMPTGAKDEQSFIRGVLSAARFLSTPGSSPNWFDKDLAIDPSLFDRLESGDIGGVEFSCQTSGGLWRCDRKLLFDCVNEAFGLTRLWHYQGQELWLQEELVWRSSRPRGQTLVVEVVKKIEDWRKLASYAIDSLIERDMNVHFGNWKRFGPEVAEVGLDIESKVWGTILEEVVVDIVSTSKRY